LEFGGAAFGGEAGAQGGIVAEAERFVEVGSAGQGSIPALVALGGDIDGESRERVLNDESWRRER